MSEQRKSDESFTRTLNFSAREESLLLNLVHKFSGVLENKRTDAETNKTKTDAWVRLTNEFNAASGEVCRTPKVLRNKYMNLKRRSKEAFAIKKRHLYGTGGADVKTEADVIIEEIIGTQMTGFDTDATASDYNVETLRIEVDDVPEPPEFRGPPTSALVAPEEKSLHPPKYFTLSTPKNKRNDNLRDKLSAWAETKAQINANAILFQREEHEQKMRHREEQHRQEREQSREKHKMEMELLQMKKELLKRN